MVGRRASKSPRARTAARVAARRSHEAVTSECVKVRADLAHELLVVEDGHPRTHVVPDGRPAAVPRRVVVGGSVVGDEAWCAVWHQAVPREACRERSQGSVVNVDELGVRQHLEVSCEEGLVEVVKERCDDSRGWEAEWGWGGPNGKTRMAKVSWLGSDPHSPAGSAGYGPEGGGIS